jgi:hypothetical protein
MERIVLVIMGKWFGSGREMSTGNACIYAVYPKEA